MLISSKYNFLFIHIPKTGGLSVSRALASHARFRDQIAYIGGSYKIVRIAMAAVLGRSKRIERIAGIGAHARLSDIYRVFGEEKIKPLTKICFIRNPFTRAFSQYAHIKRYPSHERFKVVSGRTFEAAIPEMCARNMFRQSQYFRSRRGMAHEFEIDFVGGYERLEEDVAALSARLNLPRPPRLPRINVNPDPPADLRESFGRSLDVFIKAAGEEFDLLGYSTDIDQADKPPSLRLRR